MFGRTKKGEDWKTPLISVVKGMADAAVLVDAKLGLIEYNRMFLVMAGHRHRTLLSYLEEGHTVFDAVTQEPGHDRSLAESARDTGKQVHDPWVELRNARGDKFDVMRTLMPIVGEDGACVGILAMYRDVSAETAMHDDYKKLLAQEAARADNLERQVEERTAQLRNALEEVTRLSRVDPLTGVLNRRAFSEHATQAVALAARHGRHCAFLMTDLDFFKSINDNFGHASGDSMLKAVSAGLQDLVRGSDKVARFGGEEFVILLAETNADAVFAICERVRAMVMELPIETIVPGKKEPQTVSIGAAIYPECGASFEVLIENADKALYVAKETGRNQSIIYTDEIGAQEETTPDQKPPGRSQPRVLLVDDDQVRLEQYREHLGKKYLISTVTNVENAAAICVRERFDVIVASQRIGDEDGLAFLHRSLAERPSAVRILLTEEVAGFMSIRAANRGRVDQFLLESEAAEHLEAAIADAISRRELALQDLLEHADLEGTELVQKEALTTLIDTRAIKMVYQPIFDATSRERRAYEALCRPQGDDFDNPATLFEAAVANGLLWPLGNLVRETIADDVTANGLDLPIFVNLHPAELGNPDLLGGRQFFDIDLGRIVLEITERSSISNHENFSEFLAELRERGFRFAVDDLGAGYASLNSVALIGPEFVKVNMSLVRDIDKSERKRTLVQSLVTFANKAGIYIVAEGVETEAEAAVAQEIGCHYLQGYLLGRPEPLP